MSKNAAAEKSAKGRRHVAAFAERAAAASATPFSTLRCPPIPPIAEGVYQSLYGISEICGGTEGGEEEGGRGPEVSMSKLIDLRSRLSCLYNPRSIFGHFDRHTRIVQYALAIIARRKWPHIPEDGLGPLALLLNT